MYPILPVYVLSVSVYLYIIFIWGMKQTGVGEGCNFEVITSDYISFFFKKHTLKMSANCAQQSMILTYQILCPKPLIITGVT